MNKNIMRILCAFLCVVMLSVCCVPAANAASPKKAVIGVALYQDGGPAPTACKAYLEAVGEALNMTFKYTVLTQTDEAANLSKIQDLIASGVDGIICTMDMGMPAIIEECEGADVYLAGYLADYDTSFRNNYSDVFENEYFVGTVADGNCSDVVTTGRDYLASLLEYNERNPENAISHVAMCTFPAWAFPQHQLYAQQFVEAVEEYNQTAENPITVDPFDPETDQLMFSPMDSTYFSKHPGIDAIMSFCAIKFVYGTVISAGMADTVEVFASGYEAGDCDNFGTKGTATIQQEIVCATESVNYPLVLLFNAINGVEFPDQPDVAERQSASRLIMNSDEDMEAFAKSLYLTGNAADALFTGEDVLALTAMNPDATYAGLVDSLWHMTIEDVIAQLG